MSSRLLLRRFSGCFSRSSAVSRRRRRVHSSIASGSSGITRSSGGIASGISSSFSSSARIGSSFLCSFCRSLVLLRASGEGERQRESGENHFCVHVSNHPDEIELMTNVVTATRARASTLRRGILVGFWAQRNHNDDLSPCKNIVKNRFYASLSLMHTNRMTRIDMTGTCH